MGRWQKRRIKMRRWIMGEDEREKEGEHARRTGRRIIRRRGVNKKKKKV